MPKGVSCIVGKKNHICNVECRKRELGILVSMHNRKWPKRHRTTKWVSSERQLCKSELDFKVTHFLVRSAKACALLASAKIVFEKDMTSPTRAHAGANNCCSNYLQPQQRSTPLLTRTQPKETQVFSSRKNTPKDQLFSIRTWSYNSAVT